MKKVVIIGCVPDMSDTVFLSKLAQLIKNMDLSAEFWGWERNLKSTEVTVCKDSITKRVLLRGGGEANRHLIFWYPIWMIKIFLTTFLYKEELNYFCVSFDSAMPLAVASLFVKRHFIFANIDNISKNYRWPSLIKTVLEYLERFTARRANIHLIPSESRWSNQDTNIRIVGNTPSWEAVNKARQIARERGYQRQEEFTIYVNGWLTRTRGILTLLNAVKECRETIKLLVAGVPNCDEAKELINLKNVEYLGLISNAEALAIYYKSHLAFTFYDPSLEINRVAEPNKWGDSIVTGTPFVTNLGVITANKFIKKNACFVIDYEDSMELAKIFNSLSVDREKWREVQKNLESFEVVYWDKNMHKILEEFCDNRGLA